MGGPAHPPLLLGKPLHPAHAQRHIACALRRQRGCNAQVPLQGRCALLGHSAHPVGKRRACFAGQMVCKFCLVDTPSFKCLPGSWHMVQWAEHLRPLDQAQLQCALLLRRPLLGIAPVRLALQHETASFLQQAWIVNPGQELHDI
jgi:hypothetical protein